ASHWACSGPFTINKLIQEGTIYLTHKLIEGAVKGVFGCSKYQSVSTFFDIKKVAQASCKA
ncbi:hypothetical protein O9499_19575, partial [Proteus mirabilis]|uniref:hypothetical protein n=1 Tax=Proteus mirabilis TaxID=584 RepID=UPI002574EB27